MIIRIKSKDKMDSALLRAGYTLKVFSRAIDVHPSYLSQVMNGKKYPAAPTAKKIVDYLGLDFDDVFEIVKKDVEV